MPLEEIHQQSQNEFVLIAVTKTDEDNVEILEGDILAHPLNREELMTLLESGLAPDLAVEWCGEPDDSPVVVR